MRGRAAASSAIILGSLAVWLVGARPVAAECNPPGPDYAFRQAAPLAERIVIGTVTAVHADGAGSTGPGPSTRFTLAVTRVLRGDAPEVMAIDHLETGGCIRWVSASVGDTIALALGVRDGRSAVTTNTAAWISALPPGSSFESITVREAVTLARMTPPDTATATPAPTDEPGFPLLLVVAGAVGATAAALRRSPRDVAGGGIERPLSPMEAEPERLSGGGQVA